jgi:hypothetical protein
MIETKRFVRKPLYVDAVQVTVENFEEVALWCQGDIANRDGSPLVRQEDNNSVLCINPTTQFIRVRVHSPKSIRQTQAFVGDWVLYTERGYKVYTSSAFDATWDRVE